MKKILYLLGFFAVLFVITPVYKAQAEDQVFGFLDNKFYNSDQKLVYFCFTDGNCYNMENQFVKKITLVPKIKTPTPNIEAPIVASKPAIVNQPIITNPAVEQQVIEEVTLTSLGAFISLEPNTSGFFIAVKGITSSMEVSMKLDGDINIECLRYSDTESWCVAKELQHQSTHSYSIKVSSGNKVAYQGGTVTIKASYE